MLQKDVLGKKVQTMAMMMMMMMMMMMSYRRVKKVGIIFIEALKH